MKNGLYMPFWYDTLTITPPSLTIKGKEVDEEALSILDKALTVGDREADKTSLPVSTSTEF